jgi:hypothetical protein
MPIAAQLHLGNENVVPHGQSMQKLSPAERLRMVRVALLPVDADRDQGVQFPMFSEQAVSIKISRVDIPDAHEC